MKKLLIIFCLSCSIITSAFSEEIEKLIILGAGPAGLTSSLFAAQAGLHPLVIEGNSYDGQITSVHLIENYPGFPEGISGADLAERIHTQAENLGVRFHPDHAIKVDLSEAPFHISLKSGQEIYCES